MAVNYWQIHTDNHEYKSSLIGTEADKKWNGDFYFILGSGPQIGMMKKHHEAVDWDKEIERAKSTVEKINQLDPKPRFFVVCGDFSDEMPHGKLLRKRSEIEVIKEIYRNIDSSIPLICVCGNHDVGDAPTPESIQRYRLSFGDDYFSFWCGGVFFIVLNSQYYIDRSYVTKTAEDQDRWLDEQLERAKGYPIICFSHIPWFTESPDEEDDKTKNIPKEWRLKVLDKLYNAGARHAFCAHLHDHAKTTYRWDFNIIINSAIDIKSGDKSGMRVVKVSKHGITQKYYPFDDFPKHIKL